MKKKLITAVLAIASISCLTACKDMVDNSPMEEAMKDSIFVAIDEARYTQIAIKEHQNVKITIGSKKLFSGEEGRRKEVVDQLIDMAIYYFEENNYLNNGKVVFVPNETTIPKDNDPKKEYDFDFKDYIQEK